MNFKIQSNKIILSIGKDRAHMFVNAKKVKLSGGESLNQEHVTKVLNATLKVTVEKQAQNIDKNELGDHSNGKSQNRYD